MTRNIVTEEKKMSMQRNRLARSNTKTFSLAHTHTNDRLIIFNLPLILVINCNQYALTQVIHSHNLNRISTHFANIVIEQLLLIAELLK